MSYFDIKNKCKSFYININIFGNYKNEQIIDHQ